MGSDAITRRGRLWREPQLSQSASDAPRFRAFARQTKAQAEGERRLQLIRISDPTPTRRSRNRSAKSPTWNSTSTIRCSSKAPSSIAMQRGNLEMCNLVPSSTFPSKCPPGRS